MFKKISKFISYLFVLGIQVAYNLFVIWGLHMWDFASPWISHRTTIILLALPTLIVFNTVLMVIVGIAFFSLVKKEEEKKGFKVPDKVSQWFKGEDKEDKEFKIPDKVVKWFKEEMKKDEAKKLKAKEEEDKE
ncbi:MAG: hypothetical protein E3J70_10905 [Candidatus Heimdallarchaeota archaeon]|nr:MAG: hypothetical protein E3J70_10905 [Candidatus Heimdallarchaeota archaeon]